VKHDLRHAMPFNLVKIPVADEDTGRSFARRLRKAKAIMGVFDEGCMGMYNAIVPDDLLHAMGLFKERLSQSALYARMRTVDDGEAEAVLQWLVDRGMTFK